jgi:ComF family protein
MHFYGRVPIERATSLLDYKKGQLSQTLLRRFKYEGRVDIGRILGKRLGEKMKESGFLKGIQGIIPVPLHPKKRRLRGFNQSFIFAEGLEEVSHCPVKNHWIRRHEFTSSQTKKTRLQRIENVSNAFSLQPNIEEIPPGHYLLVDDVVTTGATLEAVAKVCLDSNDVKLSVASIALG